MEVARLAITGVGALLMHNPASNAGQHWSNGKRGKENSPRI
jgi:hypothetical protein